MSLEPCCSQAPGGVLAQELQAHLARAALVELPQGLQGRGLFRLIRDSDLEIEEEAEDLVQFFQTALKRRRRGSVISLWVNAEMPDDLRRFVASNLGVQARDVFVSDGILGMADTKALIVDDRPDLVLLTIDAFRPDRSPVYGYSQPTTPALQRLAEQSLVFERATTTMPVMPMPTRTRGTTAVMCFGSRLPTGRRLKFANRLTLIKPIILT